MGDIIELVLTLLWGGGKVFWAASFYRRAKIARFVRGENEEILLCGCCAQQRCMASFAVPSWLVPPHLPTAWGIDIPKGSKPSLSLLNGFGSVSSSPSDILSSCPAAFFCLELLGFYALFILHSGRLGILLFHPA